MTKSLRFQLVTASALALISGRSRADLYSASKAHGEKEQRKALKMARELGWETASQQARLADYVASKPWTGDLFAL